MSRRDVVFFVNVFGWTYDPRKEGGRLPFILYPFQEEAIRECVRAVNDHDLMIEKSRDMGVSWMLIYLCVWLWLFYPMSSSLLLSRKEDYVDKSDNPDALFTKIDFALRSDHLPAWLRPAHVRSRMHLVNLDNGSVVDGESTNSDASRGGRRTLVICDEFAAVENGFEILNATRDTTRCRIFNSTPQGNNNAFAKLRKTDIRRLTLHWSVHPEKSVGLYRDESGRLRSPWYDRECARCIHPLQVAQELDIDYSGSEAQFFDGVFLEAARKACVPPFHRGRLVWDVRTGRPVFQEELRGPLRLWVHWTASGAPDPTQDYAIGCDVSMGTGTSNSAASVVNVLTGEKVAEYVTADEHPGEFADTVMMLGDWFRNQRRTRAFLIWEANGAGSIFGRRVVERHYAPFYLRRNQRRLGDPGTDMPGWYSVAETKINLLHQYRTAVLEGRFINHSREAVDECAEYIYESPRSVVHSRSRQRLDPTSSAGNHGDLVIADALACLALGEVSRPENTCAQEPAEGTLAYRRKLSVALTPTGTY